MSTEQDDVHLKRDRHLFGAGPKRRLAARPRTPGGAGYAAIFPKVGWGIWRRSYLGPIMRLTYEPPEAGRPRGTQPGSRKTELAPQA